MKKFILSVVFVFSAILGISAQDWAITLSSVNGLPGVLKDYGDEEYYEYKSHLLTPDAATRKVRMTVVGTITNEAPNGNNVVFALSGLKIYDKNGASVGYTASSNADYNELSGKIDGGGLPALSDDDIKSYFHSMWQSYNAVADYHYVELELEKSVEAFYIEWTTRLGISKNSPKLVGITLGTDYTPSSAGSEFTLGSAVTTEAELAAENQLFVMKSNSVKSFTTSSGTTYSGSGPIYMQCAEQGDTEPSSAHIMQLIPADEGRYLIYWPLTAKYLGNSASLFNGLNGWQYSTSDFKSAAYVKIAPINGGYFELQYDGENSGGNVTLYVGAELRDGVSSKMKTFDLPHKQALENGDYTQGFALPSAFNWSIYKANLNESTTTGLLVTVPLLAEAYLNTKIKDANGWLQTYGNHDGYCNGEDETLLNTISALERIIPSLYYVADIAQYEANLFSALSNYMAVGLSRYQVQVEELLANSTFSEYPYVAGTYPETSRQMLTTLSNTISSAKQKAGIYSAEQYVAIYTQTELEIEQFLETKVEDSGESGGDNGEVETPEEEPLDGEMLYVYLAGGDVDAYQLSALDGDYYTENGIAYFSLKIGETNYYTKEEYDSISMVGPQLPQMTSFKFNNKYNPSLNVDVICDNVTNEINLSVNAIGKWLTASFQLSDDRAVAYVDTVLQVSKETCQSFAKSVAYKVTYPGYNVFKNVKIQDEIWTTPTVAGETTEVQLTADMLSTNKPSTMSNEGLGNLLDGSSRSYFHSTWGAANNATLNVNTYIDIALPEALENVQLYYKCRETMGYNPLVWEIYASNDGRNWVLVRTLDYIIDNMPTGGYAQEYTSPTIELGGKYSYLRILQTRGEYSKNHFVLSELRVYKVSITTVESEKIQDAVYELRRVPFGNVYKVNVDWLTDRIAKVPRVDIDIEGGKTVTSKDYYLDANFRITGFGIYDNFEDSVQIKGRGNTSWSSSKKPYRLKFDEKVKPFGLTKGKSWVLLANSQSGSLMANAIAMKIGQMAGAKYTNHIIPVELYMNGVYLGNYMFTEKIGLSNNSVDIDEELGYLVELDTNSDPDEPIYPLGAYYLPIKINEPDLSELDEATSNARFERIMDDAKKMQIAVMKNEGLEDVLDIDAAARFFLANDLALNQEINHPKSTFYFKDESAADSKITFGPLWDFDWGFGYESSRSYCVDGVESSVINTQMETYLFWHDLTSREIFKKHYYKVWKEFLDRNSIAELLDYIDSYYNFAQQSFQNNANKWYGDGFYKEDRDRAKQWLTSRANYIYENLDNYNIDDLIYTLPGDVNLNNQLTVHDVAVIIAHLNGETYQRFSEAKADFNTDGNIDLADAGLVASKVMIAEAPSAIYAHNTPLAAGELYGTNVELLLGEESILPLNLLSRSGENYTALQFDIKVPDNITVDDIVAGDALASHNFTYEMLNMNTYRVVVYSNTNKTFSGDDDEIINIKATSEAVIDEASRAIEIVNAYVVDENNNELHFDDVKLAFSQMTGLSDIYATYSVKGGDCITITALEAQEIAVYGVDGRLVHKQNVAEGTTHVTLPAGIYVVNGEKVVVY